MRLPSALSTTSASPASITAATELVVPRSMPRILAIVVSPRCILPCDLCFASNPLRGSRGLVSLGRSAWLAGLLVHNLLIYHYLGHLHDPVVQTVALSQYLDDAAGFGVADLCHAHRLV